MSAGDDKPADQGLPGAHTRADPGDAGAPGAGGRDQDDAIAADLARLAAERDQDEGDQLDMLDGSPDLENIGGLAAAANQVASRRRERGRPKGAPNKRNTAVFDYLEQLGHRDPAVTLSMLQTADTSELARQLGVDTPKGRLAVLSIQQRAASDLMPYKYAKKPQALELPPGAPRPVMVIGDMNFTSIGRVDAAMSVGDPRPEKAKEINAATVRHQEGESHDDGQTVDVPRETDGEAPD